jgi:hypothetical protein
MVVMRRRSLPNGANPGHLYTFSLNRQLLRNYRKPQRKTLGTTVGRPNPGWTSQLSPRYQNQ